MYGVVEIAGHQYQVGPGKLIDVDKLDAKEGDLIELKNILFIGSNEAGHQIGTPFLEGAHAKAKVVRHLKGPKLTVFRRKPGGYQRKNGHRQEYTCLFITELTDTTGKRAVVDSNDAKVQKYL